MLITTSGRNSLPRLSLYDTCVINSSPSRRPLSRNISLSTCSPQSPCTLPLLRSALAKVCASVPSLPVCSTIALSAPSRLEVLFSLALLVSLISRRTSSICWRRGCISCDIDSLFLASNSFCLSRNIWLLALLIWSDINFCISCIWCICSFWPLISIQATMPATTNPTINPIANSIL